MRSYVTALWLLDLHDPPLPKVLTEPQAPSGLALIGALSCTSPESSALEKQKAEATADAQAIARAAESANGVDAAVHRFERMETSPLATNDLVA